MWPDKADGDPTLIAKDYSEDTSLFQSRPSVTGYAADATFFNNQGPNQQALADQLDGLHGRLPGARAAVHARPRRGRRPVGRGDESASGIDPHISDDNARIQANRVAAERDMPLDDVLALVDDATSASRCSGSAGRSPSTS